MTELVRTVAELRQAIARRRIVGSQIGFVPTMGALHEGHVSLMRRSVGECDATVVSVFVNPLQFGPREDLSAYPRDLDRDVALTESAGVGLVFAPPVEEMYPVPLLTTVAVREVSEAFEGESRPTHFAGVTTVVAKLFNLVGPCRAYFGEKDWQQLAVVRRMVDDLSFDVEVIGCETVREADGLALSSRNAYLGRAERAAAPVLHRALVVGAQSDRGGRARSRSGRHDDERDDRRRTARVARLRRGRRRRVAERRHTADRRASPARRGTVRQGPPHRQRRRHGGLTAMTGDGPGLDLLVLGSGVAGLSAAVRAADALGLRVGVLTKGELDQAATRWAQGGVAAVLAGDPDSTDLHLADTLAAGAGLCDVEAVRILVDEGPGRVTELIAMGAAFDRSSDGRLELAREGGHTLPRVVHAGGAATGAEIERALVEAVRRSAVAVFERWFALDFIVEGGRCRGVDRPRRRRRRARDQSDERPHRDRWFGSSVRGHDQPARVDG